MPPCLAAPRLETPQNAFSIHNRTAHIRCRHAANMPCELVRRESHCSSLSFGSIASLCPVQGSRKRAFGPGSLAASEMLLFLILLTAFMLVRGDNCSTMAQGWATSGETSWKKNLWSDLRPDEQLDVRLEPPYSEGVCKLDIVRRISRRFRSIVWLTRRSNA